MEKTYFVQRQTMSGIADEVRTLSGDGVMMKPETMREELVEANDAVVEQDGIMNEIRDILSSKRIPEEPLEGLDDYVDFYDYDGTLLHRYTVLEIMGMDELPPLPSHEGLICQGWNWTLEQLKEEQGPIIVAPYYIVDDDSLMTLVVETPCDKYKVNMYIAHCAGGWSFPTYYVDWGDGHTSEYVITSDRTTTMRFIKTYAKAGEYTIKLRSSSSHYDNVYIGGKGTGTILRTETGYPDQSGILKEFHTNGKVNLNDALYNTYINLRKVTYSKDNIDTIYHDGSSAYVKLIGNLYSTDKALARYNFPGVSCIISTSQDTKHVYSYGQSALFGANNIIQYPRRLSGINFPLTSTKSKYFRPQSISMVKYMFRDAEIDYITIPAGTTKIAEYAFDGCKCKEILLPDSVTSLDEHAFYNCTVERLKLSDNIKKITTYAFSECDHLRSITLPKNLESIATKAFYYSSIEHVYVPDGNTVLTLTSGWSDSMQYLRGISLPDGIAIANLDKPSQYIDLSRYKSIPTLSSTSVVGKNSLILVPSALYDEWIKATNWSAIASRIVPV